MALLVQGGLGFRVQGLGLRVFELKDFGADSSGSDTPARIPRRSQGKAE